MSAAALPAAPAVTDDNALLSNKEQIALAWRLGLSLAAACALLLSVVLEFVNPGQRDVAQLDRIEVGRKMTCRQSLHHQRSRQSVIDIIR